MRFKTLLLIGSAALAWKLFANRDQRATGRERTEENLDEALDESFPASDPPSMSNPTAPIASSDFERKH